MDKKNKITIALIHNNDQERLDFIIPKIKILIDRLDSVFDVYFYESSWQPDLKPVNVYVGLLREFMDWKNSRDWNKYRELKNRNIFIDFISLIKYIFKKYFLKNENKNYYIKCAIESYLTNKHIDIYNISLNNNSDVVLVFEDDAIFKNDSLDRIFNFINEIKIDKIPNYFDLGGGLDISSLQIDKLEIDKINYFRCYKKPVTNTTCCYLVNKEQVKIFIENIIRNPVLRYLPPDWLLNKLFLIQDKNNIKTHCFHASPSMVNHGSNIGVFKSSIKYE